MESGHKDCLHCMIVKEVGRRLERGDICGRSAMDKLLQVMADILALTSLEDVEHAAKEMVQDLVDLVEQARQRTLREPALFPQ